MESVESVESNVRRNNTHSPGSLEYLGHPGSRNSSGMDPSPKREISPRPGTVYFDPGSKRQEKECEMSVSFQRVDAVKVHCSDLVLQYPHGLT